MDRQRGLSKESDGESMEQNRYCELTTFPFFSFASVFYYPVSFHFFALTFFFPFLFGLKNGGICRSRRFAQSGLGGSESS